MTTPCIITVAITGSLPTKKDNPAVPITVAEQIESTQASFEAGATLAHCHVRNDDGTPTSSPEKFGRLVEGLKKHCPGMIIQLSTGGRSGAGRERGGMLSLKPDMASLSTGSVNFPTRIYENTPDLVDWLASEMLEHNVKPEIEAFDLSMIYKAAEMADNGKIKAPLHVQFVMGVKNAMPVDKPAFDFFVATLKRLAPTATWTGAGIGKDQITLNTWAMARRRMRRWSNAWLRCVRSITAIRRRRKRRGRCSACELGRPLTSGRIGRVICNPPFRSVVGQFDFGISLSPLAPLQRGESRGEGRPPPTIVFARTYGRGWSRCVAAPQQNPLRAKRAGRRDETRICSHDFNMISN
jgi:3-keto-5-aminohexanoate cleavage enzyme